MSKKFIAGCVVLLVLFALWVNDWSDTINKTTKKRNDHMSHFNDKHPLERDPYDLDSNDSDTSYDEGTFDLTMDYNPAWRLKSLRPCCSM